LGYRARPKAGKRGNDHAETAHARRIKRPRAVVGLRASCGLLGFTGRKPGRMKSLFLFPFNYFKAFSNGFESYFEFESNHSTQKFKCNNMSA
jgi:hypothetical protein